MSQINLAGANAAVQLQGNNTITSDQAFTFPDTGGQLVCYQQGTWTPTFNEGTATAIRCNWSRVGNTVSFYGQANTFTTSVAEVIQIGGLPYANMIECIGGSVLGTNLTVGADGAPFTATYVDNDSNISFYAVSPGGWNVARYSNIASLASFAIYWNGTYLTNDTTWAPANGATIS